jgi:hypothetical protein
MKEKKPLEYFACEDVTQTLLWYSTARCKHFETIKDLSLFFKILLIQLTHQVQHD